jgi:hypothetical protein
MADEVADLTLGRVLEIERGEGPSATDAEFEALERARALAKQLVPSVENAARVVAVVEPPSAAIEVARKMEQGMQAYKPLIPAIPPAIEQFKKVERVARHMNHVFEPAARIARKMEPLTRQANEIARRMEPIARMASEVARKTARGEKGRPRSRPRGALRGSPRRSVRATVRRRARAPTSREDPEPPSNGLVALPGRRR